MDQHAVQESSPSPADDRKAATQIDTWPEFANDDRGVPEGLPAGDDAADGHDRHLLVRQCAARAKPKWS